MNHFIQRVQSYLTTPAQAQEKISDLLIELRHRGINFEVREINEDGEHYFLAKSVGYPRGTMITTGRTPEELGYMIKDAIFTSFGVPARYCNPDLINLENLSKNLNTQARETKVYATT
jgi:hypothetical protein